MAHLGRNNSKIAFELERGDPLADQHKKLLQLELKLLLAQGSPTVQGLNNGLA